MANKMPKKSTKVTKKVAAKRPARAKAIPVATKNNAESASKLIDKRIKDLGDWRGKTLQRVRAIIRKADPKIVEEWKWETPVWSRNGIICTGETYKDKVKLTFAKGALLKDPSHLFNSSLEGKVRRAIDIHEGETINEDSLKDLIRAAIELNGKSKS